MKTAERKTTTATLYIFRDKNLMLEGTAGSGKTTLMKHVCQQWAKGKLLHDVDLLIHLSLADPTLWSAKSLEDIILYPTSKTRRAIDDHIVEQGGKKCCFILDGWEDLPKKMHTSFIHNLQNFAARYFAAFQIFHKMRNRHLTIFVKWPIAPLSVVKLPLRVTS